MLVILPGMRFDGVSPSSGKQGDIITMTGSNFGSDCELTIGRKVVEITELTPTRVKFKVPIHTPGVKSLSMTCKDRAPIFEHRVFEVK